MSGEGLIPSGVSMGNNSVNNEDMLQRLQNLETAVAFLQPRVLELETKLGATDLWCESLLGTLTEMNEIVVALQESSYDMNQEITNHTEQITYVNQDIINQAEEITSVDNKLTTMIQWIESLFKVFGSVPTIRTRPIDKTKVYRLELGIVSPQTEPTLGWKAI